MRSYVLKDEIKEIFETFVAIECNEILSDD
jgi:hypothetical protein